MNTQAVDFETRVMQYVALRDEIKRLNDEHKKKMSPYNETLERLNALILNHLNDVHTESVRTKAGTAYKNEKTSATVADKKLFKDFVIVNELWDLVDLKANAPAVEDHIKENGSPPPGVNFTRTYEAGVRRPTKKEE